MRKKPDHKKLYIAMFIIAVMVLSTFGFILSFNTQTPDQQLDYNGFKFRIVDNQWTTKVDGQEYAFYFHPLDMNIQVPGDVKSTINTAPKIYLTFDPEITELQYVDLARFKLSQFLTNLGKNVENAVLNQTELYDLSTITCQNASAQSTVIQFKELNQSKIFIESDYCIRISAFTSADFVKHAEGIIYTLLGVI